nr:phosphatase PAP2 family protein [Allomuricauda sp.]
MRKILIISVCILAFLKNGLVAQVVDDSPMEVRAERALEHAGDIGQFVPVAASLLLVAVKNDEQGAWQLLKGMGANLTLTYLLKYTLDKPRPEGALDGMAFPSGHTSFAFQGASFIQRRYGWGYGVPAYVIASFVAYSRIEGINDRHDLLDVLGGALVGIGSSYLFTTPYQRERFELTFSGSGNQFALGFIYKF